jgi:predicted dinucleotide-utilizing enzyme
MGRHTRELELQVCAVDDEQRDAEATMIDIADKIATMDLDDDPGLVDRLQVERDACARAIERLGGMRRAALENRRPDAERADLAELLAAAAPTLAARVEALVEVFELDAACAAFERALAAHEKLVQTHVMVRSIAALAHRAGLPQPRLPELPSVSSRRLMAAHGAVQALATVAASLEAGSIGAGQLGGNKTIEVLEQLATPEAEERAA